MASSPLFLGLDCSTQSLKATVIDTSLHQVNEVVINYDKDLPQFGTKDGVIHHADGRTKTTPTVVFVAAIDLVLDRLVAAGVALGDVAAISASGQQHGSVYWKTGASARLASLDASKRLSEQIDGVFSVPDSPLWMDSSTTQQCRELEQAIGGPRRLTELTGSIAYERFTVNQIRKIAQQNPTGYAATERISLISSFVASVFAGRYAPIDLADGSGMNVLDISKNKWVPEIVGFAAPDLEAKLGQPDFAHASAGAVSRYFVDRYGFNPKAVVINASGDNPCSVAGMRLREGDIAISLGTSDTMFGCMHKATPQLEGHVFRDPVHPAGYMALLCYKNGSLTRELVRDSSAGKSWDEFNRALESTPAGNDGHIGFFFKEFEITPRADAGFHRFDAEDKPVAAFPSAANEVRAVVEGQFLSMLHHSRQIGLERAAHIYATGGASGNRQILQILADVFGVPVYTLTQPNSASLGAAYRALHGWKCLEAGHLVSFDDVVKDGPPFRKEVEPRPAAHSVYTALVERYARLEQRVLAANK